MQKNVYKFTLVTDQSSVAFILDSRRKSKIKNNKVQQWRMELAFYSYKNQVQTGEAKHWPTYLFSSILRKRVRVINIKKNS